jgi:cytochrome c553
MRNIEHDRRDSSPAEDRKRARSWLAGAALLAGITTGARAAEPDPAATLHAQTVAVTICGTCHGREGNSTQPKFPRLAGQHENYLIAQLKSFRSQSRGDPDAIGYMWGMASELDDATIADLAAYYAAQKAQPSGTGTSALIASGRDIYEHGVAAEGVPACSSCHGPDAHGLQDYPRLAGQHAQYILKQLASFQSNMRNIAIMHGVAQNLRLAEMQAVAAYLESQP